MIQNPAQWTSETPYLELESGWAFLLEDGYAIANISVGVKAKRMYVFMATQTLLEIMTWFKTLEVDKDGERMDTNVFEEPTQYGGRRYSVSAVPTWLRGESLVSFADKTDANPGDSRKLEWRIGQDDFSKACDYFSTFQNSHGLSLREYMGSLSSPESTKEIIDKMSNEEVVQ